MTDADRLYRELAATAELPLRRRARRILGEAEAVAADLRDCDRDVQRDRAAIVVELLDEIEQTGHSTADAHIARAKHIAEALSEA